MREALAGVAAPTPMSHARRAGDMGADVRGRGGAVMMTEIGGASNAKAKRELAWQPSHPSSRQRFAT
jgi:hypothetical protein